MIELAPNVLALHDKRSLVEVRRRLAARAASKRGFVQRLADALALRIARHDHLAQLVFQLLAR